MSEEREQKKDKFADSTRIDDGDDVEAHVKKDRFADGSSDGGDDVEAHVKKDRF